MPKASFALLLLLCGLLIACPSGPPGQEAANDKRGATVSNATVSNATVSESPSILLVTLDTTRADALASGAVDTPNFDALRARGQVFNQAYTTAPTTLPAHASMFTGLLPIDHGIHENARYLDDSHALLAEKLRDKGYKTAAFISGYPLARTFGLSRGFEHYDDELGEAPERRAKATTDRALAWIEQSDSNQPTFLWVHYFDPHEPYDPPEPFRSRYSDQPYLGEIAYLDQEFGRLIDSIASFWDRRGSQILVIGDHGEGLGEHGEQRHGHLLYQATMRVPLILAGDGIEPGEIMRPVSARQVFATILDWAGVENPGSTNRGRPFSATGAPEDIVLGEAMKPYLQYSWQPQVMAVDGHLKMIRAGTTELYDVVADPAESQDLATEQQPSRPAQEAVRDYLTRMLEPKATEASKPNLSAEERERLASLGYVGWSGGVAPLRDDAPAAKNMTHLFAALDAGSGAFVRQDYERAVEIFNQIADQDPHNLMVILRLAVAHSVLDRPSQALDFFERARKTAPQSTDVRHYLAMHYFRHRQWDEAAPLFETVLMAEPKRLPALRSLAQIRRSQQDFPRAIDLLEKAVALQAEDGGSDLLQLGEMRMAVGDTDGAIEAFERARDLSEAAFNHFLELGVLYLANRDFNRARDHLDLVRPDHSGYAMALFKRAQISVLIGEPDRRERIREAWSAADGTTRGLIERETLFRNEKWRDGN